MPDKNYIMRHHQVTVIGAHDDLCDCMDARSYKRNSHGAFEQK